MSKFFKRFYWVFISASIVLFDQFSKYFMVGFLTDKPGQTHTVINDFFSLSLVHNEGIAFGMFSGDGFKIIVAVLTAVMIFVAAIVLLTNKIENPFGVVAIAMIIGGGIGNLIDRIFLRYVVDFLSFTFWGEQFAVFNVADIFVTVGTFLFVLYFLWNERKIEGKNNNDGTKKDISDN